MDRTIRTIDDVLELLDTLFPPEADRLTTPGGHLALTTFAAFLLTALFRRDRR